MGNSIVGDVFLNERKQEIELRLGPLREGFTDAELKQWLVKHFQALKGKTSLEAKDIIFLASFLEEAILQGVFDTVNFALLPGFLDPLRKHIEQEKVSRYEAWKIEDWKRRCKVKPFKLILEGFGEFTPAAFTEDEGEIIFDYMHEPVESSPGVMFSQFLTDKKIIEEWKRERGDEITIMSFKDARWRIPLYQNFERNAETFKNLVVGRVKEHIRKFGGVSPKVYLPSKGSHFPVLGAPFKLGFVAVLDEKVREKLLNEVTK